MLHVYGHRHHGYGSDLVGVRANAVGGDRMFQEVGFGGANVDFGGESFRLFLRRFLNMARMLTVWGAGSGS